jgi:adenylate kinase
MMTIEHVTREINRILAAIGAVEPKAAVPKRTEMAARKTAGPAAKKAVKTAGKPARAASKAESRLQGG